MVLTFYCRKGLQVVSCREAVAYLAAYGTKPRRERETRT